MHDDVERPPTRQPPFREPSHRDTRAVMWLAIFMQAIEAFVLLVGGPLLPLLFIAASSILATWLFRWLRRLLSSERLALFFTSIAAAAVPWITYQTAPMAYFSGVGLFWGLPISYAVTALVVAVLTRMTRT
jgi:hypothetical protein